MERKTAHRIFAVLVIIALVIIALPLLLNKNAPKPVQVSTNAPSFPGGSQDNNDDVITVDPDSEPAPSAEKTNDVEDTVATSINSEANTPLDQVMSTKSNISAGGKASLQNGNMIVLTPDSAAESNDMIQQMDSQTALPAADKRISVAQEGEAITFEPNDEPAKPVATFPKANPNADDLKKAAWAVLIGSFKDKNNAKHITDTLRTNGYKAFSTEAKNNGLTRVYVGPELKQITAALLASKIEKNMKLHGIVVTYQPLEL